MVNEFIIKKLDEILFLIPYFIQKMKNERKWLDSIANTRASLAKRRYVAGLTSNSNHNYNFINHNPLNIQ